MKTKNKITPGKVWKEYERGKDYLNRFNYYNNTEDCMRFYNGDQWEGLKTGGEKIPQLNIIRPIVDYKVAKVNSSGYAICYRSMGFDMRYIEETQVCNRLNILAESEWERLKYDTKIWRHTLKAAVSGDSYVYFFWDSAKNRLEDKEIINVNIYFADEQEEDIQKQKYIILSERMLVSRAKKIAKEHGVNKEDIQNIKADDLYEKEVGKRAKVEIGFDNDDGKCVVLTRFWKEDGAIHFMKSTKEVTLAGDTIITGLKTYPIAHLKWSDEQGSIRGTGEVLNIIPNQIEINKNLARHAFIIKSYAFPHIVYNSSKISKDGIRNLNKVGSLIGTNLNATEDVSSYISYLNPPVLPNDSIALSNKLITVTRELAGAGDAAIGQINPERASGAAITAVMDAQALPLSIQAANLKQFVEDIAYIWVEMWKAYNPNGIKIGIEDKIKVKGKEAVDVVVGLEIPPSLINNLDLSVKVDVSPKNPYSKFSGEQTLLEFLTKGYITFEEFLNALDDDSTIPKIKLLDMLEKKKEEQMNTAGEQGAYSLPFDMGNISNMPPVNTEGMNNQNNPLPDMIGNGRENLNEVNFNN